MIDLNAAGIGERGHAGKERLLVEVKGLVAAGHRVVVCTDTRFRTFIGQHGLEAADFNGLFLDLANSAAGREVMESAGTAWRLVTGMPKLLKLSAQMQRAVMNDGWKAAQTARPDLIVYHPKAFGGPHFAETGATFARRWGRDRRRLL